MYKTFGLAIRQTLQQYYIIINADALAGSKGWNTLD